MEIGEKMTPDTQVTLTQVGVQLAQLVTLIESLVRVEPEPVAKAVGNIASQTKDAMTGFELPFRIATKSHDAFARMLQALCNGADTETAMTVAGTKTAKDWIAKLGGIDNARKWALTNFSNAIGTAVTTSHEVVKAVAKVSSQPLEEAVAIAEEYFAKRVADGSAFRLSQQLVGYGHTPEGAMFSIVKALAKETRDKHFRAVGRKPDGTPTQVVKGTTNWEPLMETANLVTIEDGRTVFARKKAKPQRDTVHEVHESSTGSFFV